MIEFFSKLFSSEGFPARWHCGDWTEFHGWLYVVSDIGVWSAYTAIPAVLIYFVWHKAMIPFRRVFLLFGGFILACGLTHLLDALMFWWPGYRLLGLLEFLTAIISWATVFALVPIVPRALAMRSPEELEREIDARRKAEADLQRTNQDLERRIDERTAELQAADRRKDEFLATLAHELRNPLAPICNSLELLKIQADPETSTRARQMMERQVGHIVRLVDDLLDVSRITRGKIHLKREPVDLICAVRHAVDEIESDSKAHALRLSLSLPQQPIWLNADATRLNQIISNLLTNAVKYSDAPGVISIQVESRDGVATIRVRDSGIGIPPDRLEQIFVPFAQIASTDDHTRGGMGLGLSLVRRLTEMHGGTVTAHSDGPGTGSEFVVKLPMIQDDQLAETPRGQPAPVSCRRVLVVDDNQDAANTLAALLKNRWAHEVAVVEDGASAVRMALDFHPDVLLVDIGLPGISGFEVARQVRRLPEGNSMLLVALTGFGQDEDRRRSIAAGFDMHLTKPASMADLQQVFENAKLARP